MILKFDIDRLILKPRIRIRYQGSREENGNEGGDRGAVERELSIVVDKGRRGKAGDHINFRFSKFTGYERRFEKLGSQSQY